MLDALPAVGYQFYAFALAAVWTAFALGAKLRDASARSRLKEAVAAGSTEPVSLHPLIDPQKCVGCAACTHACPEGKIISMIGGKAELVDPASCIGHGACKTACPVGAIELVFGSSRRGVDIPVVTPNFETTVPGLYIAGELGGMGLIANAIEQGRQAMTAIARRDDLGQRGLYDVIVVGGGPAGISASLAAKEHKLRCLTLEQDSVGGTVARYPRGKLVMTRPAELPLYGRVRLKRVRKERLMDLWQSVLKTTRLEIREGVRVDRVVPKGNHFEVETNRGTARASTVLLALGRRGSPTKLGIPGEDLSKVVYTLDDPVQYQGLRVVVVGGGDSALETALSLARHQSIRVTLVHRGMAFNRAKPQNRQRIDALVADGRIEALREAELAAIEPQRVFIRQRGTELALANDSVIICAGGSLPTAMLADLGVAVERKFGSV